MSVKVELRVPPGCWGSLFEALNWFDLPSVPRVGDSVSLLLDDGESFKGIVTTVDWVLENSTLDFAIVYVSPE